MTSYLFLSQKKKERESSKTFIIKNFDRGSLEKKRKLVKRTKNNQGSSAVPKKKKGKKKNQLGLELAPFEQGKEKGGRSLSFRRRPAVMGEGRKGEKKKTFKRGERREKSTRGAAPFLPPLTAH